MTQYTSEQKREALAWAEGCREYATRNDLGPPSLSAINASVLLSILRTAESDLADCRHANESYADGVRDMRRELSALRAENEALKKAADNFRMHHIGCGWRESAEAAEAKLAAMTPVVEAAKQWADWVKAEEGECGNSSGNQLRRNVAALRKSRASEAGMRAALLEARCFYHPNTDLCGRGFYSKCRRCAALAGE